MQRIAKKRIADSYKALQRVVKLRHEKELQRFGKDLLFLEKKNCKELHRIAKNCNA
jgi:hypothetical protein